MDKEASDVSVAPLDASVSKSAGADKTNAAPRSPDRCPYVIQLTFRSSPSPVR
jgi:hypothetical protein